MSTRDSIYLDKGIHIFLEQTEMKVYIHVLDVEIEIGTLAEAVKMFNFIAKETKEHFLGYYGEDR